MIKISKTAIPVGDCTPAGAKRGRGRPAGSSRYAESDRRIFDKVAERLVHEPGLPLAAALRDLGHYSEAHLRRLQGKWRGAKGKLIDEAKQRHASPLDSFLHFLFSLGAIMREVVGSDLVRALQASFDRAARRHAAERRAGRVPKLPFGTKDQAAFAGAIRRFESRRHASAEELIADLPHDASLADLPPSQRLYFLALVLHELSLDAHERELKQTEFSSGRREKK